MPAYIPNGAVVASSSPVVISSSGYDRWVVVHVAGSSSGDISTYLDGGTTARPLVPWALVPTGEGRDWTYMVPAAYSLRYASYPAVGAAWVDEEKP